MHLSQLSSQQKSKDLLKKLSRSRNSIGPWFFNESSSSWRSRDFLPSTKAIFLIYWSFSVKFNSKIWLNSIFLPSLYRKQNFWTWSSPRGASQVVSHEVKLSGIYKIIRWNYHLIRFIDESSRHLMTNRYHDNNSVHNVGWVQWGSRKNFVNLHVSFPSSL